MTNRLSRPLAVGVALLLVTLDQASKLWVVHSLIDTGRQNIPLMPGLDLIFAPNPGVSMSLMVASSEVGRWVLVLLTAFIGTFVAALMLRAKDNVARPAYVLVTAGAVGNIIDRVRLGYVVDFIHVFHGSWSFYIFNLADFFISIGVLILLLQGFFSSKQAIV